MNIFRYLNKTKLVIFLLLVLVSGIYTTEAQEKDCVIDYVEFSPLNERLHLTDNEKYRTLVDTIVSSDTLVDIIVHAEDKAACADKKIKSAAVVNLNNEIVFPFKDVKFDEKGNLTLSVYPSTNKCTSETSGYCDYFFRINHVNAEGKERSFVTNIDLADSNNSAIASYGPTEVETNIEADKRIKEHKGSISFKNYETTKVWWLSRDNVVQDDCKINNIYFSPKNVPEDYLNDEGAALTLKIVSQGCIGKDIHIKIFEDDTAPDTDVGIDVEGVISKDIASLIYKPGDSTCNKVSGGPDCTYYAELQEPKKITRTGKNNQGITRTEYTSDSITYECSTVDDVTPSITTTTGGNGPCTKKWEVKEGTINGIESSNGTSLYITNITKEFDENSPCYRADISEEEGNQPGLLPECYELLAPLPGVSETYTDGDGNKRSTGFKIDSSGRQYIENTKNLELGDYINNLVRIGLGILIVMSVLMIIVAGVQYMTEESIFGKGAARARIGNAVIGLIIGLSIYLIISTINPKLLDVNFTTPEVKISFNSEAGDGFNFNNTPTGYPSLKSIPTDGSYKPNGCPEGIVLVENIHICKSMAGNLENMIKDARTFGFNLTGGGFRSSEQQIWLRNKNCQPNPETRPSKDCNPPTAAPGRSNHEAGLAVDLRCNGEAMGGSCLAWMKENAGTYKFINFPKEPWHWSHDGR